MKSPAEILIEARRLVTEVGWCKGQAVEYPRHLVWPEMYEPIAFCLMGAMQHATESGNGKARSKAYEIIDEVLNPSSNLKGAITVIGHLTTFNDREETTIEDIKKVLDLAIERAKA